MAEQASAKGYVALKVQTDATTPVTPDHYVPYYEQNMATDIGLIEDEPIYGIKQRVFQSLRGIRSHGGTVTTMAEPNTIAYFFDMLLTKGTTTGADPYTHPFTLSSTDPQYYTLDISYGSQVVRFTGVQAANWAPSFEDGKMQATWDLSALKSFYGREIASVSGAGPYTVTLTTDYDASPTDGLVVGDLISFKSPDGTTDVSATVASIVDGTQFTTATNPTLSAGDYVVLRAATPSFALLTPFLWGKTEFRFGATAAAALTATQTRLDEGTELSIEHAFEEPEGTKRSGSFDPASLVRTTGHGSFQIKKFFDEPEEIKHWNALSKKAVVMRSFSGANNEHELRVTFNDIRAMTDETASESGGVNYHEIEYSINYDQTDGQGMGVTVINGLANLS